MLNIDIIRNIFIYDKTKIELYDKVLLELNNDFDKLKQKTEMCGTCHNNTLFQYKVYDKSLKKIVYRFECPCMDESDSDNDNDSLVTTVAFYDKYLLWVHNEKYITKFKDNMFHLIKIKKKYPENVHKFILHLINEGLISDYWNEKIDFVEDSDICETCNVL